MYQKGENKRDIILNNAKELFYKKGYHKAKIKEIAAMSDDPVSLVHYYFKKKEDIIRSIYNDFYNNIDLLVYSKLMDINIDENVFLAHSINNRIYYEIILSDPHNSLVYDEILRDFSNSRLIDKYVYSVYQKYIDQFDITLPEEIFKAYIAMNFGARREFYNDYFSGNLSLSIQEGVTIIIGMFPRMLKLDQGYVDRILDQSLEIFNQLDYSKIKFLM